MQLCTQNLVVKTTVTTTEGLKENLSRGDPRITILNLDNAQV